MQIREAILARLRDAASSLGINGEISIEHPADLAHGDYSTNVALQYAKQLQISPRDLAEKITLLLATVPGVSRIELAGSGFINFTLSSHAISESLTAAQK